MSVTDGFLSFVLEQLEAVRAVSTRRMFGGVGVYSGGTFFAVIDNDTLFFKVDEVTRGLYQARGMPPFHPIPTMAPMRGYYQVPPDVIEDRDAMSLWAADAIKVGRRVPVKKRAVRKATVKKRAAKTRRR